METADEATQGRSLQNTVLLMVLLNAFSTPLMLSAANVALPAIAGDMGLEAVALSWIPTAYLMASAMFVLIFGRLADQYGRKRLFLLGTGAVIITSVMAALAVNPGMLLGARFLQGVSAAMLYATQIAIVSSVFPPDQRGRVLGLVVSAVYAGLASGPLLGGYVVDTLGWRFSFLLQVPLALVVLCIGLFRVDLESATIDAPFDITGAFAYAGTLLLFCLGVTRLPAPDSYPLLAASVAAGAFFFRHARRAANPLWDVRLFFANRVFTLSCAASLVIYTATYANVVLVSLYLQYLKGMTASTAGLVMMVQPLSMALLSPLMGRLSDRIEPRLLASLGMAVTAFGLGVLASLGADSPLAGIVLALALTGAGFALFSSPNANAIMGSVAPRHYGSASGALATTRILGQLSSMVLVTLVLALVMGNIPIEAGNYPLLEQAIRLSFGLAAAVCVPGIILSLRRGRLHGTQPGG